MIVFQADESRAANEAFWHYIDVGGIAAVLGGIAHILVKLGAMQTKIETMWEWWKEHTGE